MYSQPSSQVSRNATAGSAVGYSPQTQSAFSAYLSYISPSAVAAAAASASYANQMPRIRGPAQMPSMCEPDFFNINRVFRFA